MTKTCFWVLVCELAIACNCFCRGSYQIYDVYEVGEFKSLLNDIAPPFDDVRKLHLTPARLFVGDNGVLPSFLISYDASLYADGAPVVKGNGIGATFYWNDTLLGMGRDGLMFYFYKCDGFSKEEKLAIIFALSNDVPSEPTGQPSEPTGQPSEPTGQPSEPTGQPSEPTGQP